jgi:tRNA (guanine37-N1)-methyltransferase
MVFNVITIFPKMFDAIKNEGIIARAITKKIINLNLFQLRDFSDT